MTNRSIEELAVHFPNLFRPQIWPWGPTKVHFLLITELPPGELIANVNIIPYTSNGWIIIRLASGEWEIPGGTCEPGETWQETARRELKEEAGCTLLESKVIGAWECHSLASKPYRVHLPFPDFYRLVLLGRVSQTKDPENPVSGETVVTVEEMQLEDVLTHLEQQQRLDLAELYTLAAELLNPVI